MTDRPWLWRVAVAFVLVTLLALVLVPVLVQQRVDALREEISVAEPMRTLVTRWQFTLVRQLAAIDEQLLTGDTTQRETYREALLQERQITNELAPLARQLGPRVVEQFGRARALTEQWHARVREEDIFRYGGIRQPRLEVSRELDLFGRILGSLAAVDAAIAYEINDNLEAIRRSERNGVAFTLLLGALALLAAGTVIGIQSRVRSYALEAERRRSQAAAALVEMTEAEEERNRLLRGITHDVKNPLGAARGYVDLLLLGVKAPVAPEQKPLLEGVDRSINSALGIIEDMLDVSRSAHGTLAVNRVRVDLNEVAADVANDFRAASRTAGHRIEFVPAAGPLVTVTDPARVRQVLENLLSNAIKYTPSPGHITVRVRRAPEAGAPAPGTWAVIMVSDTGPGIPPEKRETVFEEYARLQQTRPAKGHGLGLAIARGIARRLGGDLTIADSQPGATFVLWLPIEEDVTAPTNEVASADETATTPSF